MKSTDPMKSFLEGAFPADQPSVGAGREGKPLDRPPDAPPVKLDRSGLGGSGEPAGWPRSGLARRRPDSGAWPT